MAGTHPATPFHHRAPVGANLYRGDRTNHAQAEPGNIEHPSSSELWHCAA